MKNTRFVDYEERLIEELKDSKVAKAYLNAALADEDPRVFLLALKDVVQAQCKMTDLAKETKLNRENLYRMLSRKGNPKISSIKPLLAYLGLKLSVEQDSIKK